MTSAKSGRWHAIIGALVVAGLGLYGCGGSEAPERQENGPLSSTATSDTVPPAIPTGLAAMAISPSRIDLSWSASSDNIEVTGYQVFRDGALVVSLGDVVGYQDNSLVAATSYTYTVRALDAAGNISGDSAPASATTLAVADTTPPTVPANLTANAISSSQINLNWNASSDNVGIAGYRVYRDSVLLITLGAVTTFSDGGLSASTTYSYNVEALDLAGNPSGLSTLASATTQAFVPTPGTPAISGVSGTISQGQSITISGGSFGTKGHAGPMLWDDFDAGANGSAVAAGNGSGTEPLIHQGNLAAYSAWERGGVAPSNHSVMFNNSSPKASSLLHARATFSDSSYWSLSLRIPYSQFTTGNELYISYYYRFTKTSATFGRQTKAWMAFNSNGNDKAYWSAAFATCQLGPRWSTQVNEPPDNDEVNPFLNGTAIDGEWVRFESYLKQSSPGGSNGAWHQVVYRPTLGTPGKHTETHDNYVMRTTSADWVIWTFGGAYYSMCSSSNTAIIDVDDFYMDSTRARVEICDTPTWLARGRCELQLPTSWSDASITATFKKGYLPSSTTAYVYVINASGNVNAAGFPVTVGP